MPGCGESCRKHPGAKQTLLRRQADRSLLLSELHSAAIAVPELCADFMQSHDILTELEIVGQLVGTSEAGQEVDDMLLLVEEVLGELVAALLELLLSSELDDLLALLSDVLR